MSACVLCLCLFIYTCVEWYQDGVGKAMYSMFNVSDDDESVDCGFRSPASSRRERSNSGASGAGRGMDGMRGRSNTGDFSVAASVSSSLGLGLMEDPVVAEHKYNILSSVSSKRRAGAATVTSTGTSNQRACKLTAGGLKKGYPKPNIDCRPSKHHHHHPNLVTSTQIHT